MNAKKRIKSNLIVKVREMKFSFLFNAHITINRESKWFNFIVFHFLVQALTKTSPLYEDMEEGAQYRHVLSNVFQRSVTIWSSLFEIFRIWFFMYPKNVVSRPKTLHSNRELKNLKKQHQIKLTFQATHSLSVSITYKSIKAFAPHTQINRAHIHNSSINITNSMYQIAWNRPF